MSVLVVDGDNLLTIGFYGLKNHFYKGRHIGAIFHFLNTLRGAFETYNLEKIVVFWDGLESSSTRKKIYPQYKENRHKRVKSEEELNSYNYQKNRVKQYLEELFVRQGEYQFCESDDCIAFYSQISKSEKIIIYSSDGDLFQLLSEHIKIYNPQYGKLIERGDMVIYDREEILVENLKLAKIICGDKSDNISGIQGLGIKKLKKHFPEVLLKEVNVGDIIEKSNKILNDEKKNKTIANLLNGVTKDGVLGSHFFSVNQKIVNLNNPFLTDEAKQDISNLLNEPLDPEGRSYKNTMKMMVEDGLFNLLPKTDEGWINFLNPFLKLTRKEKNKKTIKIKNYE